MGDQPLANKAYVEALSDFNKALVLFMQMNLSFMWSHRTFGEIFTLMFTVLPTNERQKFDIIILCFEQNKFILYPITKTTIFSTSRPILSMALHVLSFLLTQRCRPLYELNRSVRVNYISPNIPRPFIHFFGLHEHGWQLHTGRATLAFWNKHIKSTGPFRLAEARVARAWCESIRSFLPILGAGLCLERDWGGLGLGFRFIGV